MFIIDVNCEFKSKTCVKEIMGSNYSSYFDSFGKHDANDAMCIASNKFLSS